MADMTEQEFAEKLFHDKAYRAEVAAHLLGYDPVGEQGKQGEQDEQEEQSLGEAFNAAAIDMGMTDFDVDTLDAELKKQMASLGFLKKLTFLGSIINAGKKAKKTREAKGAK